MNAVISALFLVGFSSGGIARVRVFFLPANDTGSCSDGFGVAVTAAVAVYIHLHYVGHREVMKLLW